MDNVRLGTAMLWTTLVVSLPLFLVELWYRQFGWAFVVVGSIAVCLVGLLKKKEGT